MKKALIFSIIFSIMLFMFLINCPTETAKKDDGGNQETSSSEIASSSSSSSISSSSTSAGDEQTFTMGAMSIDFHYVPGKTFLTHTDDGGSATVNDNFWMGEKEITYELWYAVRIWAQSNGYTFANLGMEGSESTGSYPNYDDIGDAPTAALLEPVTVICWRDAMIFCNALTEYYNANNGTNPDLSCVYYTDSGYLTPIRICNNSGTISWETQGSQDAPYIQSTATGFRLPSSNEWELTARYINDLNIDGDISDAGEYYSGNNLSGAYTFCIDEADVNPANGIVDNKDANDLVAVYKYYYQSGWVSTGVIKTANTGSKNANALGIYDMSGNVFEYCFDWYSEGSTRVMRGGSWENASSDAITGYVLYTTPIGFGYSVGFRVARNVL